MGRDAQMRLNPTRSLLVDMIDCRTKWSHDLIDKMARREYCQLELIRCVAGYSELRPEAISVQPHTRRLLAASNLWVARGSLKK